MNVTAVTQDSSPAVRVSNVVGPYHLLERLGEGGFGEVWEADQREPVRRRVAVKLLKPGLETRAVLARFEAERQALASMDHPNIAQVLDAGTTELGRPWFAMELVRGLPITQYADRRRLSVRRRLELFVTVCRAVQHAHQKGLIHRDLKPGNVLVAEVDGEPVPKVIDFGIAKAMHGPLTDMTLHTLHGQMVGTLEYMSPEQADGSTRDIDTRADVYALGVMLYELLTGELPLDTVALRTAGPLAMREAILVKTPAKPSTRLSPVDEATRTAIAKRCPETPVELVRRLRGDIDWIVLKCLEKDRTRRYETADALAADILRHLANEPITAGAPSRVYKAFKFVRRHQVECVAALVVFAVLVVAVFAMTTAWWSAEKNLQMAREAALRERAAYQAEGVAKAEAAAQAERQQEIRSFFLETVLSQVNKHEDRRSLSLIDAMTQATTAIETEITDPRLAAETRQHFAVVLTRVGADAAAAEQAALAESAYAALGALDEPRLANLQTLGVTSSRLGDYRSADAAYAKLLDLAPGIIGADHPEILKTMASRAHMLARRGDLKGSLGAHEAILAKRRAHPDASPQDVINSRVSIVNVRSKLGEGVTLLDEARAVYADALALDPAHETALFAGMNLVHTLANTEDPALAREGLALAAVILDQAGTRMEASASVITATQRYAAQCHGVLGDHAASTASLREAVAGMRSRLAANGADRDLIGALVELARSLHASGDTAARDTELTRLLTELRTSSVANDDPLREEVEALQRTIAEP